MFIAKEGIKEIALATLVLGGIASGLFYIAWPLAVPFVIVWLWVLAFFRDPPRHKKSFAAGELCSPADGTITEVVEIENHPTIGGPAVRIGMFLSLFNVHINRSPCAGTVRSLSYRKGEFLDARHPESGQRNESNSVVIDPVPPLPGPVVVRQVAGLVARRIVCHAKAGQSLALGQRFGLIKFGSRTELIIPLVHNTEVTVAVGDRARAGLTLLARQPIVKEDAAKTDDTASDGLSKLATAGESFSKDR